MMGRQITNEIIFVIVQIVVIFTLNVISTLPVVLNVFASSAKRCIWQKSKLTKKSVRVDKEIGLSGQRNPATFFSAKSDESEFVT